MTAIWQCDGFGGAVGECSGGESGFNLEALRTPAVRSSTTDLVPDVTKNTSRELKIVWTTTRNAPDGVTLSWAPHMLDWPDGGYKFRCNIAAFESTEVTIALNLLQRTFGCGAVRDLGESGQFSTTGDKEFVANDDPPANVITDLFMGRVYGWNTVIHQSRNFTIDPDAGAGTELEGPFFGEDMSQFQEQIHVREVPV